MQAERSVAIDLPQKIQVFQDTADGPVMVAYNPPNYLVERHPGIAPVATLATIGGALSNIASAASGVDAAEILAMSMAALEHADELSNTLVSSVSNDGDFDATYDPRLIAAIDASPTSQCLLEVDHEANAIANGLTLLPTRLVIFGNPAIGTPLMQDVAAAGIDLPALKIVVWEDTDGCQYGLAVGEST